MKHLRRIRLARLNLLLLVAVAVVTISCNGDASTFNTAGPVAELQANLLIFVTVIAAVVFVFVEGLIIFIVLRYRRKDDKMPAQTHGNKRLEILWTVIPAIIIVVITIPTIQAIWSLATQEHDMEVSVVAHQWWFEFRYPSSEIVTANELHIPTGTTVRLELHSQDVLHSFWVPRLFGKRDLVPNQTNFLSFSADEPGRYEGVCAEFCGIAHANMKFTIIAHTPEEFGRWETEWFNPPADLSESAAEGRLVFQQHCATCHSVDSYRAGGYTREINLQDARYAAWTDDPLPGGSPLVSAPNLTHFGMRTTLASGIEELNSDTLFRWIENPSSLKIGTRMQAHAAVYLANFGEGDDVDSDHEQPADLASSEIEQLVDYLLELTPEGSTIVSPCFSCNVDDSAQVSEDTGA